MKRLSLLTGLSLLLILSACGEGGHPHGNDAGCPNHLPDNSADMAAGGSDLGAPDLSVPTTSNRFTLAVIPDTQYLFDADRGNPDVLAASLSWIVANSVNYNIAFTVQLGDLVQNAMPSEFTQLDKVFQIFDQNHIQYGYAAGNHDVTNSNLFDNQRANTEPYLQYFSPTRTMHNPTFGGATTNGFNSYYIFDGAGEKWLLLALDWRASAETLTWAQNVLNQHPTLPVILTTHELVVDDGTPSGQAVLSGYGQTLWDSFIKTNDQIFLTLNGHFWPPARTVLRNNAGHEVHLNITNYQDRYFGGSGMIRLYEFDLDKEQIEVSTFSPWTQAIPPALRNNLAQAEAERTEENDRFVTTVHFKDRFRAFAGPPLPPNPPPVPAPTEVIASTVAYWRFEGTNGMPLPATGVAVKDLSGNGNDLTRVTQLNGKDTDLIYTNQFHPNQPSRGSLYLNGLKGSPASFLRTADGAPMNGMTFASGYTIEAFLHLPADCCANHAWMGVLSRMGTGGQAGKLGDDQSAPVGEFAVSPGREMQWAIYPTNLMVIETNWSHLITPDTWIHVALVNDGHQTVMYIDGCPVVRNPHTESIGITTNNEYWMVGASHYNRITDQSFYGWLGDVRIVSRPLGIKELMISR